MKATHPYHIILGPMLTEESTIQMESKGKYIFRVKPDANKKQIREAIERLFNVNVVRVNTMNYLGKRGAQRQRGVAGRRPSWKKAVVTIGEGQSIDLL